MKLGEWWVVFDEKGRARGFGLSKNDAWFNTWTADTPGRGHVVFTANKKKRGWTCEKIEIRRPG